MANPVIVELTGSTWNKVATNVMGGIIHNLSNDIILQTYRNSGDPPPTDKFEGIEIGDLDVDIQSSVGIDIYLWSDVKAKIRLDL